MSTNKLIDWNKASELNLIERINREVLHPLGLAMCRNPETGISEGLLISNDGLWCYEEPEMDPDKIFTNADIQKALG